MVNARVCAVWDVRGSLDLTKLDASRGVIEALATAAVEELADATLIPALRPGASHRKTTVGVESVGIAAQVAMLSGTERVAVVRERPASPLTVAVRSE